MRGELVLPGEVHWYPFEGKANDDIFAVLVEGDGMEYMILELLDSDGTRVSNVNSSGSVTTAMIDLRLAATGRFVIRVRHYSGQTGAYTLSFNQHSQ